MNITVIMAVIIVSALYFLISAFTMITKNLLSSVLFKFIPFVLGMTLLISAATLGGYLPGYTAAQIDTSEVRSLIESELQKLNLRPLSVDVVID